MNSFLKKVKKIKMEITRWRRANNEAQDNITALPPQRWPHARFRQYTDFQGACVLEIGGNRNCYAASRFVSDGAAKVFVSGLEHVAPEDSSKMKNVDLIHADALDIVRQFGEKSFDFVYGVSILEHIPNTSKLLDEIYSVLRPGGMVYLQGGPLWSSATGHHIGLTPWKDGTTKSYFFNENPRIVSENPIPFWGHLLMQLDEMRQFLLDREIPVNDVEIIVDAIYSSSFINRYSSSYLANAFGNSKFTILETNYQFHQDVPSEILMKLMEISGVREEFGAGGVEYILVK